MLTLSDEYVCQTRAKILPPVDVVVAGAGASGCVAALAAARNGARVMLIEERGFLGGMLTGGYAGLTMFTKFSGKPEEHEADLRSLATNPEALHVAGGIPMEIAQRLLQSGHGIGNDGTVGAYLFTSSEDFKRVLVEMMEEAGVHLRLHTMIVDVIQKEGIVEGVVMESKSGREVQPAKLFIDATGDGDLCVRAGAEYTVGVTQEDLCATPERVGKMQLMGAMFKVGNVDFDKMFDWLGEHREYFAKQPDARFDYEEALARYRKGEMTTLDILREGCYPRRFQVYNLPTKGVATLCCSLDERLDGCNADDLTRAECLLAKMLAGWMEGIRAVPGFEKAFLLQVPEIGVRETRHIQGDHLLTLLDLHQQRTFEDCIGFGAHPVDTRPRPDWLEDPGTSYPSRWFFQIPFRSLLVKGLKNILTAGRCISATHEAFGSIRPTVQCMIIGEAAGTAAALATQKGISPRDLPYDELRDRLKRNGALC